jgi:hypothetical protein
MSHKSHTAKIVKATCFDGFLEYLHLKIMGKDHHLEFITVYRSPDTPTATDEKFLNVMLTLPDRGDLIMLGDFNLPGLFSAYPDNACRLYESMFISLGMFHSVTTPTRGNNVLDLLMSSDAMLVYHVSVEAPFST